MENQQDTQIRDAQYRKSRSIAFFNATNSAISLLGIKSEVMQPRNNEDVQTFITFWREWFLSEYDKDYKDNVMTIGLSPEVLKGLDAAKKAYEGK